jgi:hypothetical protein
LHGPTDRNRVMWEEIVVMLPQNTDLFTSGLGKLILADFQNDGSGAK